MGNKRKVIETLVTKGNVKCELAIVLLKSKGEWWQFWLVRHIKISNLNYSEPLPSLTYIMIIITLLVYC